MLIQVHGTLVASSKSLDFGNNIKLDIRHSVVIRKDDSFSLKNGLYLFYRLHGGIIELTKVYLISIYKYHSNNYFIKANNLIKEFNSGAFALEYNPYSGVIRMVAEQTDDAAFFQYISLY